jgi:hypothetical protein
MLNEARGPEGDWIGRDNASDVERRTKLERYLQVARRVSRPPGGVAPW